MSTDAEKDTPKAFHPDLKGRAPKEAAVQLSSHRTGMAFQRSRLSADRTLMAVMRTSLSLIGFGFTIFQFFMYLQKNDLNVLIYIPPRVFGLALGILGIGMLIVGINYHMRFMKQVKIEREALMNTGLLPANDKFPISLIMIVAILLLIIGILSIVTMLVQANFKH